MLHFCGFKVLAHGSVVGSARGPVNTRCTELPIACRRISLSVAWSYRISPPALCDWSNSPRGTVEYCFPKLVRRPSEPQQVLHFAGLMCSCTGQWLGFFLGGGWTPCGPSTLSVYRGGLEARPGPLISYSPRHGQRGLVTWRFTHADHHQCWQTITRDLATSCSTGCAIPGVERGGGGRRGGWCRSPPPKSLFTRCLISCHIRQYPKEYPKVQYRQFM